MKYRGIPACSIELNPYLHFVGTVKTRTYTDLDAIEACISAFLAKLADELRQLPRKKRGGAISPANIRRKSPGFTSPSAGGRRAT